MAYLGVEISGWELAGLLGACLYATSYVCAALDHIPSQSIHYYLLKLVAAVLVLASLTSSFNLASVVIQVFFIVVSVIGVARHVGRGRHRDALRSHQQFDKLPEVDLVFLRRP